MIHMFDFKFYSTGCIETFDYKTDFFDIPICGLLDTYLGHVMTHLKKEYLYV